MDIRKKLITVLSVLLFALGLEACDKENAIAPEISYKKSSNLQTWEKYKIGFWQITFFKNFK